jgi:hypothetical protein
MIVVTVLFVGVSFEAQTWFVGATFEALGLGEDIVNVLVPETR